tara:strand:+ start:9524 stop:10696 length:1173 start_codon:yes stop_codon:yes gene_type:complete
MPCKKCENGKYRFGDGACRYNTLAECEAANSNYKIVELVIDKDSEQLTIDAISLVSSPAIEQNFVYFKKQKNNLTLAAIDEEKRLLISPALIPYKQIYRYDEQTGQDYYVFFTAETVRKASEMYLKHNNNNNATIQHEEKVSGVYTVESWIVQDSEKDKTALYGYNLPVGTWAVSMRIENDEVWQRIKEGELKGLSIEGYFVDKMQTLSKQNMKKVGSMVTEGKDGVIDLPLYDNKDEALAKAEELGCDGVHEHSLDGKTVYMPCADHDIIKTIASILDLEMDSNKNVKLASYTDYPKGATANAERAIIENEERGNKCATQTGKVRAQQLAARRPISFKTVKRIYSYLSRAKTYNTGDFDDCGTISYHLWGGDVMLRWSARIIKRENETN